MVHPFTPGDDLQLIGAVDTLGRRWTQIVQEVGFSVRRSPLELKWRYEFLEGEERNRLAMLLEREYFQAEDPLDGIIEIHFAAQSGDGAPPEEAAGVLSGSSDDDDEPPFVATGPGFLPFCQAMRAELLAAGRREPLPVMVQCLGAAWRQLPAVEQAEWAALAAPQVRAPVRSSGRKAAAPRARRRAGG